MKRQLDWEKHYKPLLYSALGVYLVLLTWVVMFKCTLPNIHPTHTFEMTTKELFLRGVKFSGYGFTMFNPYPDHLLNILVFMPLGIYLPFILKKRYCLPLFLFVTLFFELTQLFSRLGCFDVLDIILNFIGSLIGFGLYFLLRKFLKNKTITIINLLVTIIFGTLALATIIYTPIYFTLGNPFQGGINPLKIN